MRPLLILSGIHSIFSSEGFSPGGLLKINASIQSLYRPENITRICLLTYIFGNLTRCQPCRLGHSTIRSKSPCTVYKLFYSTTIISLSHIFKAAMPSRDRSPPYPTRRKVRAYVWPPVVSTPSGNFDTLSEVTSYRNIP
jgi:hypothetical protein